MNPFRHSKFSSAKLVAIRPELQKFVNRGEIAGIVTLVSHRGKIVSADALGWSNLEEHLPMQQDTLFRIASMTKPITSVAALMLIEEGKLALDAPVTKWVPELGCRRVLKDPAGPLDDTVPAHREITIEDLMTHRSGISYGFLCDGPIKAAYDEALDDPAMNHLTPDEWFAGLGRLPLLCQPGERFQYGQSSDVLGFLIGRVEGKPFREVLRERIFAPLGMPDTDFWLPQAKRQ
jgi:CubicO group peptidase (beta-lactamase class C family)